ncbi:Uncharacterized protein Rs2_05735 [Raphanus sativus]|nr:Uncharacterized protein Rs2_05735 [Raphanus sativus]
MLNVTLLGLRCRSCQVPFGKVVRCLSCLVGFTVAQTQQGVQIRSSVGQRAKPNPDKEEQSHFFHALFSGTKFFGYSTSFTPKQNKQESISQLIEQIMELENLEEKCKLQAEAKDESERILSSQP